MGENKLLDLGPGFATTISLQMARLVSCIIARNNAEFAWVEIHLSEKIGHFDQIDSRNLIKEDKAIELQAEVTKKLQDFLAENVEAESQQKNDFN